MKFLRICAALAALFGALSLAADDVSPWDLWRQGYTSFEKGESARDRGDHVQALEHFRAAVKSYRAVQKARPSWNQNVINSRIMLCEQEIADAQRLLGKSAGGTAASASSRAAETEPAASSSGRAAGTPRPRGDAETLAAELVKMQSEVSQYKQKLYSTLVELEDLRRQATRGRTAAAEMENMLRERRVAEEKYRMLEARCKDLETKAARPSEELAEANRKLVEMRINLETGERKLELARGREQNQIRENAELLREKNELKTRLDLVERKLADADKEAESLRNIRSQAAQEKNATLQKAAELEKQLAAAKEQLKSRDVFASLLERPSADVSHPASFLLITVRNRCLNLLSRKQMKERVHKLLPIDEPTDDELPQDDQLEAMLRFIDTELTPQTREVVRLRFMEHMKYRDIASHLGISEAAVYKHLAQAIRKLKQRFNP